MRLSHPHLAQCTTRVAALSVLILALAGCQSIAGTQSVTQVRFIHASPDAPALDLYQNPGQNSPASLYSVGFGTVSSYMLLAPGAYTQTADVAGTQQQIATATRQLRRWRPVHCARRQHRRQPADDHLEGSGYACACR
jgi:hypothetical protein